MKEGEDQTQNEILRQVDADQIAAGAPILSILVTLGGGLCSVTEESIEKYKLRRPGERDTDMIRRLREEAFAWARTFKVEPK
jgi:hypothetical protein